MLPVLGGIAIVAIMAAISDAVSCCLSSAITDAYREVSEQIKTHSDLCNYFYFSLCLLFTLRHISVQIRWVIIFNLLEIT